MDKVILLEYLDYVARGGGIELKHTLFAVKNNGISVLLDHLVYLFSRFKQPVILMRVFPESEGLEEIFVYEFEHFFSA